MTKFTDSFVEIVASYAAIALWSSINYTFETEEDTYSEPSTFEETGWSVSDISDETMNSFRSDIADFLDLLLDIKDEPFPNGIHFEDIAERMSWSQFGHDFWLTRNGHGAGFWDRGYGEFGEILTRWAMTFGEVNLYVNSDDEIEAM